MESLNQLLPLLIKGTSVTVEVALASIVLATFLAILASLLRVSPWRPAHWFANAYVEVFRGTSLLVQLFWLFFVLPLPPFRVTLSPMAVAIVGLGLNFGAYGAEVLRGALKAVPRGQFEAAVALNMPPRIRLFHIILPQAMISALPPATNLMIELLKATSLVSLITLADLSFRARQLDEATFATAQIFLLTLLIYFFLAQILSFGMRRVERRFSHGILEARK